MRRYDYADSLSTASVAAGGTLGILIPPSVPMVVYGLLTQADIGKLFIAGLLPGLLMIAVYLLAIALTVRRNPAIGRPGPRSDWVERWLSLGRVWGVAVLFVLVLGGIYFGVCTPTEAAGIGSAGALLFILVRGRLSWQTMMGSLLEAGRTTTAIFIVMIGALVFANFLTMTGMIVELVAWIERSQMTPTQVLIAICVIYLMLGCVFESLGMMLVTIPVFFPVVQALGIDLVWFGVIVVIAIEIGLITPPVGMNIFVVKSVAGAVSIGTVVRGILPFVLASMVVLLAVVLFPSLALFLPGLM
jgi:tripartite ATP-independent transporter DctM subunit